MGAETTQRSPLLLTAAETAAMLGTSVRTVRRFQADGTLSPVRIGSSTRWPVDEVHAFVDRLKAERDGALPVPGAKAGRR